MKTEEENPDGLYQKYYIQKIIGYHHATDNPREHMDDNTIPKFGAMIPELRPVDGNAEYFVLRLDDGGKDKKHIDSCRKAIKVYADEIRDHIPQLSKDLYERYNLSQFLPPTTDEQIEKLIKEFKFKAANTNNEYVQSLCNESWRLLQDAQDKWLRSQQPCIVIPFESIDEVYEYAIDGSKAYTNSKDAFKRWLEETFKSNI